MVKGLKEKTLEKVVEVTWFVFRHSLQLPQCGQWRAGADLLSLVNGNRTHGNGAKLHGNVQTEHQEKSLHIELELELQLGTWSQHQDCQSSRTTWALVI